MNELIELLREELSNETFNKENCMDFLSRMESELWGMEDYTLELESKVNKLEEKIDELENGG